MWKIEKREKTKHWAMPNNPIAPWQSRVISRPTKPIEPTPPIITKRPIRNGEPLAYCANCKELTPMRWLPKAKRGKRAEQWFQCEFCGCRKLTLRYFYQSHYNKSL